LLFKSEDVQFREGTGKIRWRGKPAGEELSLSSLDKTEIWVGQIAKSKSEEHIVERTFKVARKPIKILLWSDVGDWGEGTHT